MLLDKAMPEGERGVVRLISIDAEAKVDWQGLRRAAM